MTKEIKLTKRSSKKRIREAWLEALRSGEYKRTSGKLTVTNGKGSSFCCLGVLCDLAVKAKVVRVVETDTYKIYDSRAYYLPLSVQNWAGLSTDRGFYDKSSLAADNDNGKSFKRIAKIIEKHSDELFV